MNDALTKSASISFDATALVDWASEFYALERLTAGLDVGVPGSFGHSRRVARSRPRPRSGCACRASR